MPAKRPSKPWRLLYTIPSGLHETKHRSEPATYREVIAEKERIAAGESRTERIRVEKWSVPYGQWELIEIAYPEED
ncbi:hypothetical protein OHB04_02410 [Streptomyces sp. NBC_01775]|uniref:hypothetical protein n=1 Tax=Streptomyces sp. NBC_01775 TaxID=2975939 RepID=UPI002DDBF6F9|nr:hypothetical protein [Streptomyces sp. NBC_01775]WSB74746.1 hypothetical protein OHB04_02410 [Streptomyces sp. NBC_01775]